MDFRALLEITRLYKEKKICRSKFYAYNYSEKITYTRSIKFMHFVTLEIKIGSHMTPNTCYPLKCISHCYGT